MQRKADRSPAVAKGGRSSGPADRRSSFLASVGGDGPLNLDVRWLIGGEGMRRITRRRAME
ncbi:MAG: hypothetical protein LC776_17140, partial [Acidobacteria bacterium]|nr:hypothetical protein [Acidobacteriota bacterium]